MTNTNDIVEDVFSRTITNRKIFKDRNVLRNEYIPTQIYFRDSQIRSIAEIISPVLLKNKPSNILIYGKTGTGKTVVTRFTLNKLVRKTSENNLNFQYCYINARNSNTDYRILFEIASTLNVQLPFTGLSISEAFNRIINTIKTRKIMTTIVIDEIDFLVRNYDTNLLYELTRANENLETNTFISLIGISNDLRFKESLDPRVLSSLGEEEVMFTPYTIPELQKILNDRAKLAFNENAITPSAINLCAALAGTEHGDARRAVDLLRVAGELAEREGSQQVTDDYVKMATQSIEQDRVAEATRSLPLHAKIILLTVSEKQEWPSTGSIYVQYTQTCKKIGIEALTQRRISSILNELDILGLISAPVISQGRLGRSKKIKLTAPYTTIISALKEDEIIRNIVLSP
ncbi:MAG: orc1/cdc6 family replication initiation protein [Conexivisphaerales archaeon]